MISLIFFYLSVLLWELLAIDEIDRFEALDDIDPLRDIEFVPGVMLPLLLVSFGFSFGKNTM